MLEQNIEQVEAVEASQVATKKVAKKTATKKVATKKSATKKSATKKSATKKSATKKTATKKVAKKVEQVTQKDLLKLASEKAGKTIKKIEIRELDNKLDNINTIADLQAFACTQLALCLPTEFTENQAHQKIVDLTKLNFRTLHTGANPDSPIHQGFYRISKDFNKLIDSHGRDSYARGKHHFLLRNGAISLNHGSYKRNPDIKYGKANPKLAIEALKKLAKLKYNR